MALLSLRKLTVRFGGLTAVSNFDLDVQPNEIVSVIGPNGAGKTTVFNVITGVYSPTDGSILLDGRPLQRPVDWRIRWLCALVGIATGLAALLVALNLDKLWLSAIKRPYVRDPQSYSLASAWREGLDYVRGLPALQVGRSGRWLVVTPDAGQTLVVATTRAEAERELTKWRRAVELGDAAHVVRSSGKWNVTDRDDAHVLAGFDTEQQARQQVADAVALARVGAARRRTAWLMGLVGLAVGSAGTWTVWSRARRTPDVVARAGIARTFQNIRLFGNMTAIENVATAMDSKLRSGVLRMALRTPGVRREEAATFRRAGEILAFVGLSDVATTLAKNLPYGKQRRLEIARALATEPRLILLDEPAAGMNPAESADLMRLIENIRARGVTVLLIEHHMKVVMGISNRVAVLDYGVKIAEGTPEQVRTNPDVIKAYLGSEEIG